MATSRLEKIGTIITRTSGLLKSGAMKVEDKPIWYDIVAAFPPKYEPKCDRLAPKMEIKSIFYTEDIIRAKYYNAIKNFTAVNLLDRSNQSNVQKFIEIYKKLESQGPLSDESIMETALELYHAEIKTHKTEDPIKIANVKTNPGLVSSFSDAQKVNIKDIFKN